MDNLAETLKLVIGEVKTLSAQAAKAETTQGFQEQRIKDLEDEVAGLKQRIAELEGIIIKMGGTIHADQVIMDNNGEVKHISEKKDNTGEEAN